LPFLRYATGLADEQPQPGVDLIAEGHWYQALPGQILELGQQVRVHAHRAVGPGHPSPPPAWSWRLPAWAWHSLGGACYVMYHETDHAA
jgi:hypothetical protein